MAGQKEKVGVVVSNRMRKTIVVQVERLVRHPRYRQVMKQSKTYKVHDEKNESGIGDTVRIRETRPLSKEKYHTLVQVVERAKVHASEILREA